MMCFRDMTFCHDAEECKNHKECPRWLSPELKMKAIKWWGGVDYPVAFSSFKSECPKFEEMK